MKTQKIIFAEDSPDLARLLRYKLSKEGYDVIGFNNGEGVVEAVKLENPDLVLLDVMMPIKNGYEILKEMKANPDLADIPVIFLSAKSGEKSMTEGFEEGASDYITKPFSPNELLARIKRLIK